MTSIAASTVPAATNGLARGSQTLQSKSAASTFTSTAGARGKSTSPATRAKNSTNLKPTAMSPTHTETNVAAKHANDRLLFLLATFVGQRTTITLKSGEQFGGLFAAASLDAPDSCFVLKMTKPIGGEASREYCGFGEDHTLVFDVKEVSTINVFDAVADKVQSKLPNGTGFQTDTDISGNLDVKERQLEAWNDSSKPPVDLSMNGPSPGAWDQFAANEKLFGVKTDYDETMYTTAIDRSAPSYKQRAAMADRLAQEIESSETTNTHIAEERNLQSAEAVGLDEEARYSEVVRSLPGTGNNKYTPPARRVQASQAPPAGPPADPAIISAVPPRIDAARLAKATQLADKQSESKAPTGKLSAEEAALQDKLGIKPNSTNLSAMRRLQPSPSTNETPNATANVQTEVRDAFKSWSANERLQYQEHQKAKQKKERDSKINDLKMFSANFKLKSAVPHDILGILARDKDKQKEIERKSEVDRTAPKATPKEELPAAVRQSSQDLSAGKDRTGSMAQPRVAGQLGQRLLAQQQQNTKTTKAPAGTPMDLRSASQTGVMQSHIGGAAPPAPSQSPLNVQAMEFKPNPAASAFQPLDQSGKLSPRKGRSDSRVKERPVNRVSFFSTSTRPDKKSIAEAFNPIPRLKQETVDQKKTQELAQNGGIPQAYRTAPTWTPKAENEERSYLDIMIPIHVPPPQNSFGPQHMPPHVQQGFYNQQRTPQFRNQHHFDEQRGHANSSQSSVQPSPSMRQSMLAHPQQGMNAFPQLVYPQANFTPGRPYSTYAGQGAPPPMMSQSSQGQYIAQQQMPMYPNNPQFFAVPTTGFQSPRQAPVMMHQGSQQMHVPQQFGYAGQGGYGFPQHGQPMPVRGGVPMMQQGSFNSNSGMPHHIPPGRGSSFTGSFPQQPAMQAPQPHMMHPNQMMSPQPGNG